MGDNVGDGDGTGRTPPISQPCTTYRALPCTALSYPALPCPALLRLSFSILFRELMHKHRGEPASHEERPTKDTGTHEGHASQYRPTTHPTLGALLSQLESISQERVDLELARSLPGGLFSPKTCSCGLPSLCMLTFFPIFFCE